MASGKSIRQNAIKSQSTLLPMINKFEIDTLSRQIQPTDINIKAYN